MYIELITTEHPYVHVLNWAATLQKKLQCCKNIRDTHQANLVYTFIL